MRPGRGRHLSICQHTPCLKVIIKQLPPGWPGTMCIALQQCIASDHLHMLTRHEATCRPSNTSQTVMRPSLALAQSLVASKKSCSMHEIFALKMHLESPWIISTSQCAHCRKSKDVNILIGKHPRMHKLAGLMLEAGNLTYGQQDGSAAGQSMTGRPSPGADRQISTVMHARQTLHCTADSPDAQGLRSSTASLKMKLLCRMWGACIAAFGNMANLS